mmetsp:Transcript_22/g.49  ORF Transcript_22/g.49 Transcript_22/m.49 type:complete len:802 (+) Transcript_22:25-2430(+)
MSFPKWIIIALLPLIPGIMLMFLRDDPNWKAEVTISGSAIKFWRDTNGVIHYAGRGDLDYAKGLGYIHAMERLTQMQLQKVAAHGRLSELVRDSDATRNLDARFRKVGFQKVARRIMGRLSLKTRKFLKAYTDGVNHYLKNKSEHSWFTPKTLELFLIGMKTPKWDVMDTLAVAGIFCYMGLTSLQQEYENLVLQLLTSNAPLHKVQALFSPHLDDVTEEIIVKLREVRHFDKIIPENEFAPSGWHASNNWAISGNLTSSGGALLAGDPHLEVARLPPAFIETVYHDAQGDCSDPVYGVQEGMGYAMGLSLPGFPALAFGRTRNVGYTITFGCMDQIDTFVEEVKAGQVKTGDRWQDMKIIEETLHTKNGDIVLKFFETANGIIEREDDTLDYIEDGFYLSRAWTWPKLLEEEHFLPFLKRPRYCNVSEAMQGMRDVPLSANLMFADSRGNIGYQQTGLLPQRKGSGLAPVPGWDKEYRWGRQHAPSSEFLAIENPESGYLITANQFLQAPGSPLISNAHGSMDRTNRIETLISNEVEDGKLTMTTMKNIQKDLVDIKAQEYLSIMGPVKGDCAKAQALRDWDFEYRHKSKGAAVYQELYLELIRRVFGRLFGWNGIDHLYKHFPWGFITSRFDTILLEQEDTQEKRQMWLNGSSLASVLQDIGNGLCADPVKMIDLKGIHEEHDIMLKNIFFQGKLPRFLGVDAGPIEMHGSPNTIVQGRVKHGLDGSIGALGPVWRAVTDMSTPVLQTALAGGQSGRLFSRFYLSDFETFFNFDYKVLDPHLQPPKMKAEKQRKKKRRR